MDTVKTYTVIIYTENQIGLLAQVSNIFTRRSLSIWSLHADPSPIQGVHTIKIETDATEVRIREVAQQLEKRVEVIRVFYYPMERLQEVKDILASRDAARK